MRIELRVHIRTGQEMAMSTYDSASMEANAVTGTLLSKKVHGSAYE